MTLEDASIVHAIAIQWKGGCYPSHKDMSSGGYSAQWSVVMAATPLLLKKIFAQLGHANVI